VSKPLSVRAVNLLLEHTVALVISGADEWPAITISPLLDLLPEPVS
jgi:hypothetical protein